MLLTLTVRCKGDGDNAAVLGFNSRAPLDEALARIGNAIDQQQPIVRVNDEYEQEFSFLTTQLVSVTVRDVSEHWSLKKELSIAALRAEAKFNQAIQEDPTIRFLAGGTDIPFGRK